MCREKAPSRGGGFCGHLELERSRLRGLVMVGLSGGGAERRLGGGCGVWVCEKRGKRVSTVEVLFWRVI